MINIYSCQNWMESKKWRKRGPVDVYIKKTCHILEKTLLKTLDYVDS